MNEFDELLELTNILQGPEGCPWDKSQDFYTLQQYVLEEAHEVVDAVDQNDDEQIACELGDLLYTVLFYAKVAEREGRFTLRDILNSIKEKIIRRHPHVFENRKMSVEEVIEKWEKIKMAEQVHGKRESILDGIPKNLHALARAQKIIGKIKREHPSSLGPHRKRKEPLSEKVIGEELIQALIDAEDAGLDAEGALRRSVAQYEQSFRNWEKT